MVEWGVEWELEKEQMRKTGLTKDERRERMMELV
jgi:hypothetical protein